MDLITRNFSRSTSDLKGDPQITLAPSRAVPCDLCGSECASRGSYTILGKYEAQVAQCRVCGYTFAVEPHWLDDAYSSPMTDVDIGPLYRCIEQARVTKILIELFHDRHGRCLDFGGGYGLFVRRMRDLGYHFFWHDTHSSNLFAKGFEAEFTGSVRYEMITAFEVLEHLVSPHASLKRILSSCESFLFSTVLLPEPFPAFNQWWYFGPEQGQHVSFYTLNSLSKLAGSVGKRLVTDGVELHMITSKKINDRFFRIVTSQRVAALFGSLCRRDSFLLSDFEAGRRKALEQLQANVTKTGE